MTDLEAERPSSGAGWSPRDDERDAWEAGRQRVNRMTVHTYAQASQAAERLLRAAGRPPSPAETRSCARLLYVVECGRWAESLLREVVAGEASVEMRGAWRFVVVRKPAGDREPEGGA